jgi:glutaredoxin 3
MTYSPIFSTPRLNEREDGDPIQKYLYEKTGQSTVPNVFVSE